MIPSSTTIPRAFAVPFRRFDRWDVSSFHQIEWHWPKEVMVAIGSLLKPRKEKVDRKKYKFSELQPVTIHFDGSIDKRAVDPNREYTMELFFARPGDVVVAKIDLKNGAVGIIPEGWTNVVVTNHFAVYEPDRSKLLPEYFHRLIQTSFFKAHLWRNKVGAEGRKEVKLDFFEALEIPLPSLDVQKKIASNWQSAIRLSRDQWRLAAEAERGIPALIYELLGTTPPVPPARKPKAIGMRWSKMGRWSFNYVWRYHAGLLGFVESKYPIEPLGQNVDETSNGYCIKPVARPTSYKMLKLNALSPGGLDLDKTKFIDVPEMIATRFSLRKGDLLICRSVGSYEHVAKCALVPEDESNVLFPDIIIRTRFKEGLLPEYVREVIQTPLGRSYFQSNARTAVGMWKIGSEDILNFPIPVPPKPIQEEIVRRVSDQRSKIAVLREAAGKAEEKARVDIESLILGTQQA